MLTMLPALRGGRGAMKISFLLNPFFFNLLSTRVRAVVSSRGAGGNLAWTSLGQQVSRGNRPHTQLKITTIAKL